MDLLKYVIRKYCYNRVQYIKVFIQNKVNDLNN